MTHRSDDQLRELSVEIVQALADGVILLDSEGRCDYINPAAEVLLGCRGEEILGKPGEIILAERRPTPIVLQDQGQREAEQYEIEIARPDGSRLWIRVKEIPRFENGRFRGTLLVLTDLSDVRRAAAALHPSEQRFHVPAESLPEAVIVYDEQSILYVNRAGAALLGLENVPPDLINQSISDVIHPDEQEGIFATIRRSLLDDDRNQLGERRVKLATDEVRHFQASTSLITYLGKPARQAIIRDITQKKELEQGLLDALCFVRSVLDGLSAHIAVIDNDGVILTVNQAWRDFAALNGGDGRRVCEGANYLEICAGASGRDCEEGRLVAAAIQAVLQGQSESIEIEYPCHAPDQPRWFVARITPFPDDEGQRAIIAHHDITQQKRDEAALVESEERFRELIETAPVAVIAIDSQGAIVLINQSIEKMFGYDRAELLGQPLDMLMPERFRSKHSGEHVPSYFKSQTGRPMGMGREFYGLCKDGTEFPIEVGLNQSLMRTGETLVLAYIADITERRRAETRLRDSEERFRKIYENSPLGIALLDGNGTIWQANAALCTILGFSEAELLGMNVVDYTHPDDVAATAEVLRLLREQEAPFHKLQKRNIRKDGTTVWVNLIGARILGQGDQPPTVLTLVEDITRRKEIEAAEIEQRVLAEALRDTAAALSATLNLDEVLERVLNNVGRVVPHDAAHIMLIQGEYGRVVRRRGYEQFIPEHRQLNGPFSYQEHPVYRMMSRQGMPCAVPDVEAYPGWARHEGYEWIRSYAATPILLDGKCIGFIELFNTTPGFFTLDHANRLRVFADQAATAFRNAQLYEAEREHRALAEALRDTAALLSQSLDLNTVFDHILDHVEKLIPYDAASLLMLDGNSAQIVRLWGRHRTDDPGKNMIGVRFPIAMMAHLQAMVRARRPVIEGNVQSRPDWVQLPQGAWIASVMAAPICIGDQVVGFINLDSASPECFTAQHAERLQAFAEQAAAAIRNGRLFEAERRERALAQTYQKTAETLTDNADLSSTLNAIIDYLSEVVRFDAAATLLVEGDQLSTAAARGCPEQAIMPEYHYPSIHVLYQTMREDEPIVLSHSTPTDSGLEQLPAFGPGIQSWCGIPISTRGVIIGLLCVGSKQAAAYSTQDIEAMKAFARQIALAIENSSVVYELAQSQTNLDKAQVQLNRAARLTVAGEIAAGVAHQINNPLTTILAHTHLLLQDLPADSREHTRVKAIKEAAYRAGAVVQRMLDFSRTLSHVKTDVDVNQSLLDAVALVRAQVEPHIAHINLDLAPDLPGVLGNKEHLEDVWINILLNARDALENTQGGTIHVSSRAVRGKEATEIIIRDNGPGIPADRVARIFDPFYTSKPRGTGLGLAICQDVVLNHGGSIHVLTREGQGASFHIILPAGDASPTQEAHREPGG